MANTVTLRTLVDGPKTAVVHVHLLCDGASGELTDQVVVDVSTFSPVPTKVTIEEVWYSLVGFDAMLEFDATADKAAWKLGSSDSGYIDFRCFGGLKDNSGSGSTGDVVLTTAGFTAATDEGTLIIKVRKD